MAENTDRQWDELKQSLVPLRNRPEDHEPVLRLSRDKSLILLGEASHGTHGQCFPVDQGDTRDLSVWRLEEVHGRKNACFRPISESLLS